MWNWTVFGVILVMLVCLGVAVWLTIRYHEWTWSAPDYLTEQGRMEMEQCRQGRDWTLRIAGGGSASSVFREEIIDYSDLARWFTYPVTILYKTMNETNRRILMRYCWLYIRGGVWIDPKWRLTRSLQLDLIHTVAVQSLYRPLVGGPPGSKVFRHMIHRFVQTPPWWWTVRSETFEEQFQIHAVAECEREEKIVWCQIENGTNIVHPTLGLVATK